MKPSIEGESATAPVIGTILMVAITIILAAIILAFIMGGASRPPNPKSLAATATRIDSDQIQVTFHGGEGITKLDYLSFSLNGRRYYTCTGGSDPYCIESPPLTPRRPNAGESFTFTRATGEDWSSPVHVIVVANFYEVRDTVVILDTKV